MCQGMIDRRGWRWSGDRCLRWLADGAGAAGGCRQGGKLPRLLLTEALAAEWRHGYRLRGRCCQGFSMLMRVWARKQGRAPAAGLHAIGQGLAVSPDRTGYVAVSAIGGGSGQPGVAGVSPRGGAAVTVCPVSTVPAAGRSSSGHPVGSGRRFPSPGWCSPFPHRRSGRRPCRAVATQAGSPQPWRTAPHRGDPVRPGSLQSTSRTRTTPCRRSCSKSCWSCSPRTRRSKWTPNPWPQPRSCPTRRASCSTGRT